MTNVSNPTIMAIMYEKGYAAHPSYMKKSEAEQTSPFALNTLIGASQVFSFDEFYYFDSWENVPGNFVNGKTGLTSIVMPDSVTRLLTQCFRCGAPSLTRLVIPKLVTSIASRALQNNYFEKIACLNPTPPSLILTGLPSATLFYVPDASVDTYKATGNWASIADRIYPLSQYDGKIINKL